MNVLKRFMQGRYGGDQLSLVLLFVSLIFTLLGVLSSLTIFQVLSYLILLYGIFRIFSKNISKRSMENYKFSILIAPLYAKYKKYQSRFRKRKIFKYFKCSKCKTELRLPRKKGKIIITCPKCKHEFEGRT